ncbi:MAG: S8 family serine peptidase [Acidobacteria bacterium]|nr:S8 family serine peptidase [Acidobacteriota bacterium]
MTSSGRYLLVTLLIISSLMWGMGQTILRESSFVDHGDYYYLNTGKKSAFLRLAGVYLVRHEQQQKNPADLATLLQEQFRGQLEVVQENPFREQVLVRVLDQDRTPEILKSLDAADPSIYFVSPVLAGTDRRGMVGLEPRIIVALQHAKFADTVFERLAAAGLRPVEKLWYTDDQFVLEMDDPVTDVGEIFRLSRDIADLAEVEWAEPNLYTYIRQGAFPQDPPNDTYYSSQWHHNNTGQTGGVPDADIDSNQGWAYGVGTTGYVGGGSQQIVIAIYDDGVQTNHPDLNCDTANDWDFNNNDNDPSPGSSDNHGTACAGCAAAVGNNGLGVVGSCPKGKILAVRCTTGDDVTFANAMRHCGVHADVVSCSWSIGEMSALSDAIAEVATGEAGHGYRRQGKGSPVLFASGNNASGWLQFTLTGLSAGTYDFQWNFVKDRRISSGYDTVWLDDIVFPGGEVTEDFESLTSLPGGGWTTGGDANWSIVTAGSEQHTKGETGRSARAGAISHRDNTFIDRNDLPVGAGDLTFWAWVSCQQYNVDFLGRIVYTDYMEVNINGAGNYFKFSPGQYGHQNLLEYPASLAETIAVGASNDGGYTGSEERTDFSQWGPELDFVSPGNGIYTTDRTGSNGYNQFGDYYSSFGGTSAATPIAAGVAAVILSYNYNLTAADVRQLMRNSCDEIGPYAYTSKGLNGRNDYYGHGRINLYKALDDAPLLVALASFRAYPRHDRVVLRWETLSEVDNAGFNVWRADSPHGDYEQLNHYLIPAAGGETWGATYYFNDEEAIPGKTYYYQLEDIEFSGQRTVHGPVKVTAGRDRWEPVEIENSRQRTPR